MNEIDGAARRVATQRVITRADPSSTGKPVSLSTLPSNPTARSGDTVELSDGRTTMLSRLFRTTDPAADPGIYRPGSAPSAGNVYMFLTENDRDTIASVYEYVRDQGIDPRKVDGLAFDLACFRRTPDSARGGDNVGRHVYQNGDPVLYEFEPAEEATAQRILTSKAIKDSALPETFLRDLLDSGFNPIHAVDFDFLEQLVYATSSSGSDGATDPTAVLAPRPKERLAAMQEAGLLAKPRNEASTSETAVAPEDLFARFAAHLGATTSLLSDKEKNLLASLYADNESRFGPESPQMRRLDELVHTLTALRSVAPARTENLLTRLPSTW